VKIESKQDFVSSALYLPNRWKFSSEPLQKITEDLFQSLPTKAANTANTEYLSLGEGEPKGAFILRIDSDKMTNASISFNGFAASNQIILFNETGSKLIYQHPAYSKILGEYHRIQQDEIIFDLELGMGANYLIMNYKFLPYENSGKTIVNAGFAQWAMIGDRTLLESKADKNVSILRIPLGVFLCLGIYSLLIYFSRGRSDQESLYLFLINIMFFLKELASQKVLVDFFGSNGFTQIFGSTVFATTIMASVGMVQVVRLVFDNRFFRWLSSITLANCLFSLSASILPLAFSVVPFTSTNNLCALVNFVLINMVLLPYSVVQAIRTKHYEVVLFAIGLTFLGCGIVVDLINVINAMHWPWVSMWGGMIFSLLLAKNNSKKFADTYKKSDQLNHELRIKNREIGDLNQNLRKLNENLEHKVEEKTNQLVNRNRKALKRFLPPEVVDDILSGKVTLQEQPEKRFVTIMFVDLVNFTHSTEFLGPEKTGFILNQYLEKVSDTIFENHGSIDKFLGDGIMVIYGFPNQTDLTTQIHNAISTAEKVLNDLKELNASWEADALPTFQVRIGIHSGPVVIGSFGSKVRSDFTAIGSTVNIAARIEPKALPDTIFISETCSRYCDGMEMEDMGTFALKGISEPMRLFRILTQEERLRKSANVPA
jgi:class 3 adenylate cyclase